MESAPMPFTKIDHAIIDSYKDIARGIASFFGSHCEVVVHSLNNLEQSLTHIENGHISGRGIGAPITNFALELLSKNSTGAEAFSPYNTTLPNGKRVKSITMPIKNGNNIIGMLCINLSMDVHFIDFIRPFLPEPLPQGKGEYFGASLEDMMQNMMNYAISQVLEDKNIPNQEKNKRIIAQLHDGGFFHLKGSTEALAESLQISIHTIYSHVRRLSSGGPT